MKKTIVKKNKGEGTQMIMEVSILAIHVDKDIKQIENHIHLGWNPGP